jgi:hypothetical protein
MSNRWPGGLIRKTPVTPAGPLQNGAASGVWSLADAAYWTKQGLWPTAGNFLAVEDVFSTWLYTGNASTQTITNGIDLAGKGGLVWLKNRTSAYHNYLYDTTRGATKYILSSSAGAQGTLANDLTAFGATGFSLGNSDNNVSANNYASWTFREAPNFFDVVTYTGTGANRNIAHNLGSVPGMILVKRTDTAADWQVYHRSNANTQYQVLNTTAAVATGATRWNSTTPTSSVFTVGTDTTVNASGGTYVAYLFAHDTSSTGIIQCGSYTGNGTANSLIATLGFEPQWLLVKRTDTTSDWIVVDVMRGAVAGGAVQNIYANGTSAEVQVGSVAPGATGIMSGATAAWGESNASGGNYIYVAIRRGPMKTPTLGTSVFAPVLSSSFPSVLTAGFPVDMALSGTRTPAGYEKGINDRLRGFSNTSTGTSPWLVTQTTAAETTNTGAPSYYLANNTTITVGTYFNGTTMANYLFQRAPGFFDEVCYTGNGTAMNIPHNLGVAPELVIIKSRNSTYSWLVVRSGGQTGLILNSANAQFSDNMLSSMGASSIQFAVNNTGYTQNGITYVAYLFASCPGVSKVGSYTGTGTTQTINCGFTTGARFVLIKRTDSTGDWYVWDSARGIVAGNDPYIALNTTAAEVTGTDYVDTDNSGFQLSSTAPAALNANGGTYIFLAIA